MSQKSSLHRVLDIIKRLNNGKRLNIESLSYEYEVSDRTIRRDFDLIQDTYPDFIQKSTTEFFAVKKDLLNNILMGSELAVLFNVIEIFKNTDIKFKMDKNLSAKYKDSQEIYRLNTKPFEDLKNKDVLHSVEKAIRYKQPIQIKYSKDGTKFQNFHLKPYKILFLNENFYLASEMFDENSKNIFQLSRIGLIHEVTIDNKTFYKKPSLEKFVNEIQTPWASYMENSGMKNITLLANKDIARYFKLKKFLPSQVITKENNDGSINLEFKVHSYREITELIIKFSPKLTIINNDKLSEIVKKQLIYKLKSFN